MCVVPKTRVCGSIPLLAAALWDAPHSLHCAMSHCLCCIALLVLDLVIGVYRDLGPLAPGATAPALLVCRLVVSRSIYISFYIFARARCYSFCFYYLLLPSVFTTCALYSHYIKFCYLCAAVIRMLLYLFVSFISNLYLFASR